MIDVNEQIGQARILIVDDMPENLQVLGSTLGAKGYKVAFATNGYQAINSAQHKTPDLILLDIQMPDFDGYSTCRHLKSDPLTKDVPVIFLTSKSDVESVIAGFECGAVDDVTKPFKQQELLARVDSQLKVRYYQNYMIAQNKELQESNIKIEKYALELVELNRQLIKSQAELTEANHVKDRCFAIVAHDLRGPVSSLLGMGQILVDEYETLEPDELKDMVGRQYRVSKRLYELVDNLLIWSRNQMNNIKVEPQNIGLRGIVEATEDYYAQMSVAKNITLETKIDNEITVYSDENILSTILRNLISNALKFTNSGGKIVVSAIELDDMVEICVADTGVGMSKENCKKVFLIDQKVSTYGTNNEPGTGLGLMLCKEFVEKQNGKIRIESVENVGTSVIFTVPLGE